MATKMTRHAYNDRMDRMLRLLDALGAGDELNRFYNPDTNTFDCILDNGVLVIVGADSHKMVTCFMLTIERMTAIYKKNCIAVPKPLVKRVCANCKKYKNCIEMWE